ncbi:MAG: hypothetical protein ACOX2R_08070 [Anaerolineae bacterium]|jgi:hypothetical protein
MNMDVGDLVKRIKMPSPVVAGGIGLLLVAVVATVLVATRLASNLRAASCIDADLAAVQKSIDGILGLQPDSPEAIQQRISQTNLELADLLQGFPTTDQATDQASRLYEYAVETGVQLVSLEPLRSTPEEELLTAYAVQRFYIVARGSPVDLLRFVGRLGGRPLPTMRVERVSIVPVDGGRADIDVILYASDLALEERGLRPHGGASRLPEGERLATVAGQREAE